MVVPVECWDLGNLMEAIDDPLSVLSFRQLDGESFEKVPRMTGGRVTPAFQRSKGKPSATGEGSSAFLW